MPSMIDITGLRFGMLVVLKKDESPHRKLRWWCKCDCGVTKSVDGSSLRGRRSTSCGCQRRDKLSESSITHGRSGTREYRIWKNIKARCLNKNLPTAQHYSGRGISMCAEWENSFVKFFMDMGPIPSQKHSIDRIDVNGNYEPGNCRWATQQTQARNTRIRKDNLTGCRGVTWCREKNKWMVTIRYGGKKHRIGRFETLGNAIASRLVAEAMYWNEVP